MNENMETEQTDNTKRESRVKRLSFMNGFLVGLLAALCMSAGVYLITAKLYPAARLATSTPDATPAADTVLTNSVESKIRLLEDSLKEYYLEDVSNEELEVGLYKGLVDALDDPYSTYYTQEEMKKVKESTQGIYYGIGAYVGFDQQTQYCKLTGIIPGTPAEEAGLKAEDIIVKVDGTDVQGMTTSDVVTLIKGEENTDVLLTIFRQGEPDYLEITVTRRKVEAPTVNYEMKENHIAYIQITQFEDVSIGQFTEALQSARDEGMKALILDLRSNPGGTLSAAVEIARQLLPEGLIVYTEDKNGERVEYSCDGKHQIDVPMVVLVNENSASASEILAGAIKDYGVGTLLGTTTFGKGIVQKVFGITDGSAVKLTISHYYTPKGNDIHKVGIQPDEELELDYEKYLENGYDNQLERALEILREKI